MSDCATIAATADMPVDGPARNDRAMSWPRVLDPNALYRHVDRLYRAAS